MKTADLVVYGSLPHGPGSRCDTRLSVGDRDIQMDDEARILVEHGVSVLSFGEGDSVHDQLEHLRGRECRELRTKSDGACAVHAIFGRPSFNSQQLIIERPRIVLQSILAQPLTCIEQRLRPEYRYLAETVVSELWSGFVIPWFESGGNEEDS